jgi:hypothetical protein
MESFTVNLIDLWYTLDRRIISKNHCVVCECVNRI